MQIALFVDAGYLYAQGSSLLIGQKQERMAINLTVDNVLGKLAEKAKEVAPSARLLRIYWYDGLPRHGRLTNDHIAVAQAQDSKLRLGTINSEGAQKGVDSLIVTDLIDLARNNAISDALILSGDEDIRIGVQIAQTFGVRVHLLGIKPTRGSQSLELMQEADTRHEWPEEVVREFMTVPNVQPVSEREPGVSEDTNEDANFETAVLEAAREFIRPHDESRREDFVRILNEAHGQIPPEIDRPMLAILRNRLGGDLDYEQRARYREIFADQLREATSS